MRAKLIKQNGIGIQTLDGVDYYLVLNDKIYHTNPLTSELSNGGKLSKQNCDEEFAKAMGVVDVEKLADSFFEKESSNMLHPQHQMRNFFILGFNKAMELNKYTEADIMKAYDFGSNALLGVSKNNLIQSLQQSTEIEVEVIMRNSRTGNIVKHDSDLEWDEDGLCDRAIPKLDSQGCLILKKI
jgi:hypothetical protein